jgi:hypothetical protein
MIMIVIMKAGGHIARNGFMIMEGQEPLTTPLPFDQSMIMCEETGFWAPEKPVSSRMIMAGPVRGTPIQPRRGRDLVIV